ncbi:MAG: GntR family transcriptional regulator [Actinomycetota bacterium]
MTSPTGKVLRSKRVAAPLRHQVSESLRQAIASGVFAPGERLTERDLCQRYEVSRTVIREALRQVEADGLVTMVAHRGPEVTVMSRADVAALYEVRAVLEALAGQLFAERASDAVKLQLAEAMHHVEAAMAGGDLVEIMAYEDAFHATLLDGSGNAIIATMLRTLYARIQMMRSLTLSVPGRGPEVLRELREVLAAVQASDGPRAWKACQEHVETAASLVLLQMDDTAAVT